MLFSGLTFIYVFLPFVMLGSFLLPCKWRPGWLFLTSLFFYFTGEPVYILLLIGCITLGYFSGMQIEKSHGRKKKRYLTAAVAIELALLIVFKYAGIPGLRLPLGISFFIFQIISYEADIYRGRSSAEKNYINFGTYVSMFPQLVAGPIVRWEQVKEDLYKKPVVEKQMEGAFRFIRGLGKKVLIADSLAILVEKCTEMGMKDVLSIWLAAISFMLQLYYDFSGYSDMAIGLGAMLGFHLPENFRYPYFSKSITEFWRRWHMTLGQWFRDYVYIPLGGNRVSTGCWVRNVMIVWALTGIWHGNAWNFMVWGLYFGVILLLEKWFSQKMTFKIPVIVQYIYVWFAVMIGMIFFRTGTMSEAVSQIAGLIGIGLAHKSTVQSMFMLKSFGRLLCLSFIGAGPWVSQWMAYLRGKVNKSIWICVESGTHLLLLMWITASLINHSFHPFLYFRF